MLPGIYRKLISTKALEALLILVTPCNIITFQRCYRRHLVRIKSVELEKCLKNCQKKKKRKKKRIKSPKGRGSGRTKDEHNYLEPKQGRKMWRSFLRKRDRGGMEFDTMDWYRKNVLHPAPKTIVKKETKEKKNTTTHQVETCHSGIFNTLGQPGW